MNNVNLNRQGPSGVFMDPPSQRGDVRKMSFFARAFTAFREHGFTVNQTRGMGIALVVAAVVTAVAAAFLGLYLSSTAGVFLGLLTLVTVGIGIALYLQAPKQKLFEEVVNNFLGTHVLSNDGQTFPAADALMGVKGGPRNPNHGGNNVGDSNSLFGNFNQFPQPHYSMNSRGFNQQYQPPRPVVSSYGTVSNNNLQPVRSNILGESLPTYHDAR